MTPALPRKALQVAASTGAVVLFAGLAWYGYQAIVTQPVKRVVFAGPVERIPPEALETLARGIESAPSPVSLAAVRDAARRMPWVREASVRRKFPDAVEVTFDVHDPIARWNEAGLVSKRGEVFAAAFDAPLPLFRGADAAAPLIVRQYPAMAAALAPLGSAIAELRLSPRGAWQVKLESGVELELGRGDVEARLARFAAAWPLLVARGIAPQHADLRYPNGFALRGQPPRAAGQKART
jgi:cell division protein FtsQ